MQSYNPKNKPRLKHLGKAVLRTPLNSIDRLEDLNLDKVPLLFEEGLYLASPEFYSIFVKLQSGRLSGEERRKVLDTTKKYWVRSCTRCTPYGTFAGTGVLDIGSGKTDVVLAKDFYVKNVRIDMNYLDTLIATFLKEHSIRLKTKWHTNSSLYLCLDEYRYVEREIRNGIPKYTLNAAKQTDYLSDVLNVARSGVFLKDILKLLTRKYEVEEEEALAFVGNLIESQLLISDLEPRISHDNPDFNLENLVTKISNWTQSSNSIHPLIGLLKESLGRIDDYHAVENELLNLRPDLPLPKNVLQTDLFLRFQEANLDTGVIETILCQIEDILCLSVVYEPDEMNEFVRKFYDRYEGAEVPLPVALDSDIGIGYGQLQDYELGDNTILDNLYVRQEVEKYTKISPIQQLAYRKYDNYISSKDSVIELSTDDLAPFYDGFDSDRLPKSLYVMGTMIHEAGKDALFDLSGVNGPSGANLLGRFGYGDEEILELTRRVISSEEENQQNIYAEVIHLPEARLGNILLRPILREFEIPYLGNSGADFDKQIDISDIMVSVKQQRIILRSKKHDKIILPRLSTAHNFYNRSLPIYRFLCDLQRYKLLNPVLWDWGILANSSYLPRVVYKDIILSKAIWTIAIEKISNWGALEVTARVEAIKSYAISVGIPRYVQYIEGDNLMLIDFNKNESISLLLKYLNRYGRIKVVEFIHTESNSIVHDQNMAPYTNELIIPVCLTSKLTRSSDTFLVHNKGNVERKFPIGTQWLYVKIYAGPKVIEDFLVSFLIPILKDYADENLYERFFFLRFKDEFSHLRLRFFNKEPALLFRLLEDLSGRLNLLVKDGVIDKWTTDTYQRELERYHPDLIEEAETIFFYDSISILKIVRLLHRNSDPILKVLAAVLSVKTTLDDFQLSNDAQYKLISNITDLYFKEFGGEKRLQKQLNEKFRVYRTRIDALINGIKPDQDPISMELRSILHDRSQKQITIKNVILGKIAEDKVEKIFFYLLPSYIHMSINRLFMSQQRKYEMLVLHFLERHLFSKKMINKNRTH